MAIEDTYYGVDQYESTVYKVFVQWDEDEAGLRKGRPEVIIEPIAEFQKRENAQAFVRAWNQDQSPT